MTTTFRRLRGLNIALLAAGTVAACARPSPEGDEPPLERLPFAVVDPIVLYGP